MLRLMTLVAVLLFAAFAPVSAPGRPESTPRRPRHAAPDPAPQPQARRLPPRIPNYPEFAAVAVRHAPLWEITYEHGTVVPYVARHRVTGHVAAVNDVELLDHVLTEYQPPHPVRGYYGRTHTSLNNGGR